jgi:hypothetical protein
MDQSLWRVPKVLWRYQWSQSIIAGRGYTNATSTAFPWIRPTIIFEHLRMAFIKFANPEKLPSSKLDTAKVRQRRSTKTPVPSLRKTITETSALPLS